MVDLSPFISGSAASIVAHRMRQASPLMAGGSGAGLLPIPEVIMEMPEALDPTKKSTSRINRVHTRSITLALRDVMEYHHRKRIPHHFDPYRQRKYQYRKRKPITLIIKRKRQNRGGTLADLVKTTQTKREMIRRISIRVRNVATGHREVRGVLRFPHFIRTSAAQDIGPKDMADEISRFTVMEEREIGQQLMQFYVKHIDTGLKPRQRVRISARLAELGLSS